MKVLKFGGSSAATPERVKAVIDIVKPYLAGEPNTVVFSAFGGVTDMLIRLSQQAWTGDESYTFNLKQLEDRHIEAVRSLIVVQKQSAVLAKSR